MSYFYGAPVTSFDTCNEKRSGRKHIKHKAIPQDVTDLEPVHGPRHRHKHVSRSRCVSKSKISSTDTHQDMNSNDEKCTSSLSKIKNKRLLQREIQRLSEENQALISKLELSAGDSGIQQSGTKDLKDKETLITKLRNKNQKIESVCKDLNSEYMKLKEILNHRENDYRQLHIHHEELTEFVQSIEQEKNSILMIVQKLKEENLQLREDLKLLKNLVYQLNVEIERYQDKLRRDDRNGLQKSEVNVENDEVDNTKVSESWGRVNLHALGPLLDAYQENISEKDELIKKYGKEIEEFGGRCKDVITENQILHKEVEELTSMLKRKAEEIEEIGKDAALVKEQNDILTKQVSLQKQKLLEIHAVYEKKVESMSRDNEKIHKDFLSCKSELSNIQGKYEILNEGYDKLKHNNERTMPVSVHTAAVNECKRLFEELKSQYELEKQKLNNRIKYLEETQPENERQLIIITAERDQLKISSKNLEKSLKRTQHKLEHQQNSIYSIQVSRDSLKRQLNKTTGYCEELVIEQERLVKENQELLIILKEREKENENYQFLGDNIVHRMGNLKNQIKSVQAGAKEQLATVEKHIKSQEIGADQMKTEYQRELERLKQLLRQKEEVIGKLQREKYATQDNLELVWRAATSGEKKVKDVLKSTKIYNI